MANLDERFERESPEWGVAVNVCFVSNFNNYYRAPVFNALAATPGLDVRFVFYSGGTEAYWMQQHGTVSGPNQTDLAGVSVWGTRITPSLVRVLMSRKEDVYLKCINGRFALPVTFLVARLRRKPFVLWTEVWMRFRTPGHKLGFPLVRHIYRSADAIIACGQHVRDYLVSEGVSPDRIVVAHHAVDNATYGREVDPSEIAAIRERYGIGDGPMVLFLGRFTEVKGLPYLVRAFADLVHSGVAGGAKLVLAGSGETESDLRRDAEEQGILDRVVWTGYLSPEETVPLLAAAQLLVLPSIELDYIKETWGLVVNEAFNQGTPVVATDAVGAAAGHLVRDRETGFVVPSRDVGALSRAIGELLTDGDLQERLSRNCRREIQNWTHAGMAASFAEAIRLGARRRTAASSKVFDHAE